MIDRPHLPRIGRPQLQRFAPLQPGASAFWLAAADGMADWIGESGVSAHTPMAIVVPGGSLAPRGDWRAPSDAVATVWREELRENLPAEVVDEVFGNASS